MTSHIHANRAVLTGESVIIMSAGLRPVAKFVSTSYAQIAARIGYLRPA